MTGFNLALLPAADEALSLDVTDFGVVADGDGSGTTGTDNSAALLSMRAVAIAAGAQHVDIWFPPNAGVYEYTNNRWLYGIQSWSLYGYGAKLCNTSTDLSVSDFSPLMTRHIFNYKGDSPFSGGAPLCSGYLIDTIQAGGDTLTWKPGTVEEVGVGDRILIHGFAQQDGGYTPNSRYFHWATITSISPTIRFSPPSPYLFDDRWFDLVQDNTPIFGQPGDQDHPGEFWLGKPRVMLLDGSVRYAGTYTHPRRAEVHGAEWLINPNHTEETNAVVVVGDQVLIRDVVLDYNSSAIFPRESRSTVVEACTVAFIEVDKVITECTIKGCDIPATGRPVGITSGTGCMRLTVRDNTMDRRLNVLAEEDLLVEGNTIDMGDLSTTTYGPLELYNNSFSCLRAVFSGNTLIKNNGSQPDIRIVYYQWTLGTDLVLDEDGDLLLDISVSYAPSNFINFSPGKPIWDEGHTGIIGEVVNVIEKGGYLAVIVDWSSLPGATDVIESSAGGSILLDDVEQMVVA